MPTVSTAISIWCARRLLWEPFSTVWRFMMVFAFGGTFFVFSDYVKATAVVCTLQGLPVTYVFTHDSIAVGEDGPTHEPIEHLAGHVPIPNPDCFRPADARETPGGMVPQPPRAKPTPTALVLTVKNLAVEERHRL